MVEPEKPSGGGSPKSRSAKFIGWAKVCLVIAGIALAFNLLTVQLPKLADRMSDALPDLARDFLLWFATDKTIAQINVWATEWSGILTLLGLVLAIMLYVLSLNLNRPEQKH
jgi:hypothetical protein